MCEKKSTILIVDSEPHIQRMLATVLSGENFKTITSVSGKQAVRMCASSKPDLILLELKLPDMDGTDVILAIREWSHVPIIVLSVYSSDGDISNALNLGANDFITKPFNVDVLLARINASLRTSIVREAGEPMLSNGMLRMDLVRHEVFLNNKLTAFTPKEYDLLRYFMVNRGKMLTHKDILKKIWGEAHSDDTTYLRVFIGQIRAKIETNSTSPSFIVTEPGIGYRMETFEDHFEHSISKVA